MLVHRTARNNGECLEYTAAWTDVGGEVIIVAGVVGLSADVYIGLGLADVLERRSDVWHVQTNDLERGLKRPGFNVMASWRKEGRGWELRAQYFPDIDRCGLGCYQRPLDDPSVWVGGSIKTTSWVAASRSISRPVNLCVACGRWTEADVWVAAGLAILYEDDFTPIGDQGVISSGDIWLVEIQSSGWRPGPTTSVGLEYPIGPLTGAFEISAAVPVRFSDNLHMRVVPEVLGAVRMRL